MRRIFAAVIYLTLYSACCLSQTYNPVIINRSRVFNIDTLHFLPVIGYIGIPQHGRIIPSDSLTEVFVGKLKTLLPLSADCKIDFHTHDTILNEETIKFLVNTIPHLYRLEDTIFTKIPLGTNLDNLLEKESGQYFAIFIYQGFQQMKMGRKIAASIGIGVATALLTGGLAVAAIPRASFLNVHILLIDKKDNCFVMYKNKAFNGSPVDPNEKGLPSFFRNLLTIK
jgi:hypothetical protein